MVVGLIKPYSGKVFLDEQDISSQPMFKRAQMGIGYLAQEASVFRQMSVEDNIASVMQFKQGMTKQMQREKLEALLDEFGLQHVRKSMGIQLSGGERRRTEIARALAVDPNFIFRWRRPHRRGGYSAHHLQTEKEKHWRPHHRP